MLTPPHHPEIDHHTTKLIVGITALSLGHLTNLFADAPLASISASYHAGGWSQSIFIGFLFATAAFLMAYNGYSTPDKLTSKVAAGAALGVALFPCGCDGHAELVPYVHALSAAVMFLILTYFCYGFFRRAWAKRHPWARTRAYIYAACGAVMALSILVLTADHLSGGYFSAIAPRLTFHGEYASLVAFGVSWLTASRMLPFITKKDERLSLLR
ncbi:MAG TPA: hypothetical protein VGA02_05710 [Gemmatimonadales bacterium]|jgi:hypothetical protein